jgi:trigger factor
MRATSEVLEGNRVKLSVEVPEDELKEAVETTLRRLVREVSIPGFRPGKVPRRLLEQRLGKKAIREEVIREALPGYYQSAVEQEELDTITEPHIDIVSGEEEGPLTFDAVVEVRPHVSIAGYQGLMVTIPSPVPTDEDVDAQVDRLRDQFAELTEVDRPVRHGDHVTLSIRATRDGEPLEDLSAEDLVYPVGAKGLIEGADEKLLGSKVGDILKLDAPDAQGGPAVLELIVKLVREKVRPEADDEFASEASEFDTLEELREDLRARLTQLDRARARAALREGAVMALVELVSDEPPASLVDEELRERLVSLDERLHSRKISLAQYLEATGQDQEQLLEEQRGIAAHSVKANLALRALADAEGIEITDEDVEEELARIARTSGSSVADLRRQIERSGRASELRTDMRTAKAADWLVENVAIVDGEGNPVERSRLADEVAAEGSAAGGSTGTIEDGEDAGSNEEASHERAEEG